MRATKVRGSSSAESAGKTPGTIFEKNACSWFNTTFGFMFAFLKSCVNHLFLQEPVVKLHVFVSVFHVSNHLISWTVSPYVTKYLNCCYSKAVLCKTYCSR